MNINGSCDDCLHKTVCFKKTEAEDLRKKILHFLSTTDGRSWDEPQTRGTFTVSIQCDEYLD